MWKKFLKDLDLPESFVSITLGFLVVIVAGLLLYNNFSRGKQEKATTEQVNLQEIQQAKELSVLPTTHTVTTNENLWSIAEKYYGSGYNWVSIAAENKLLSPDYLIENQTLTIPKVEIIRPESEKMLASATEPEKIYTVVAGDSLWNIAVREYGDGYAWTKIATANNLINPDLIHAGNVLRLPR